MKGCLRCVITLAEFTAEVEDDVVVEDLSSRHVRRYVSSRHVRRHVRKHVRGHGMEQIQDHPVLQDLEPRNDGSVPSFADLIGGDHHIVGIIVA